MKAKESGARNRKVVRMLVVITGLFVVLWAPWFVTRIVKSVLQNTHLVAWKVVQLVAFVSTTTNFFTYVCMNAVFRRSFAALLPSYCRRKDSNAQGNAEGSTGKVNNGFRI